MTARDEWRWTDERGVQRLVGTDELRAALASSVLPPSTLVWREGMKEWAPAFTMPELASAAIAAARGGDGEPGVDNTPTEVDVPAGRIPGPAGRGEMRTLLGLSAPETKERPSAPNLPIVVPAIGGATAGARDVITQIPKFNTEPSEAGPAIPAAPRMPGRPAAPASKAPAHPGAPTGTAAEPLANMPKQRQRTQTMQGVGLQRGSTGSLRTKTTSDIDSLWAAPSSERPPSLEPDFTKPRPAAGAPAEGLDDAGDRPSSTEVEDVEVVSERVPAPPKMPDFRSGSKTGTRPPGPPPKAPAGARKPLSSIPPPLPKRQPSIPPGPSAKLDAFEKGSLKAPPTGFESRAPGMRPQAPPLPARRGSERPPMKSTPPPGGAKRSHPPPPLKSRGPMPSTPPADAPPTNAEPSPETVEAAKAALDAVDVEITADALAEASSTPAPVAAAEAKPIDDRTDPRSRSVEPTPTSAKAEAKPSATATPQPPAATSATTPAAPTAAAKTATPAPAKAATPTSSVDAKANAGSTAPSPPTKHSATATPAPVVAQASEAAEALPPVAPKPRVDPILAASVTPPPAQIAIRNKADMSGTPTAPVAPRDAIRGARPQTERAPDSDEQLGPPRRFGESVSVPVSSLMIAGGALIAMAMTGFLVGRSSSSTGAPLRAQAGIHSRVGNPRVSSPAGASGKLRPCGVSLSPQRWAPKASKSIPFELLATPSGKLAVGYARDDNEAAGIEVDPATADIKETFSKDTTEQIEHVMPNPAGGFTVIAPGDSAALKNAIEVPIATPFYVGVSDGSIVSSDKADAAGPKLWSLPASDAINSERVEEAGAKGFAYTFRQGNDVFGGWLDSNRRPVGELVKVIGSGGSVGKPMSAYNGIETAVIFADRPANAKNWQIRIAHAKAGSISAQTKVIPLPKGGPGGDAFAPDLAGLPDGRWVLVWTEGPAGGRAVRAQTLSPALEPIGSPMALSPPAGNYGQGVIGIIGDRATVVFLSKGSQSFELWGAVLQCG